MCLHVIDMCPDTTSHLQMQVPLLQLAIGCKVAVNLSSTICYTVHLQVIALRGHAVKLRVFGRAERGAACLRTNNDVDATMTRMLSEVLDSHMTATQMQMRRLVRLSACQLWGGKRQASRQESHQAATDIDNA